MQLIIYIQRSIISNWSYIEIKKKYPSTILIKANKTKFVATTYKNQKKYFLGLNKKLILSEKNFDKYKLPLIFGQFKVDDFFISKIFW